VLRRLVFLTPLLFLFGCGDSPEPGLELIECERLAFVPRGALSEAGPFPGRASGAAVDLLVDRYEVTRSLWDQVRARHSEVVSLDGRLGQDWGTEGEEWLPAVGMSYLEAQAFAGARGLRLPTAGEWLYIAGGSRAQYYPWGNSFVSAVSNTSELGLGRALAAGSFPGGVTAGTGVYDMVGNVWEWTSPPLVDGLTPYGWLTPGPSPHPLWVMGGSSLYPEQPLYRDRRVNAQGREPDSSSADVGLRCVVEAKPFLRAKAAAWSTPGLQQRVTAVGRRWGRPSVGLLERLAAEPGAQSAIGWLLEGARR
jgi:Sulfatase-modifying factor enzyme 1